MVSPAEMATSQVTAGSGWVIKIGKMVDTPNQIIAFYDSGGQNPNPKWRLDYPTFQVRVRGNKGDYSGAYAKVREVRDALLGIDPFTVSGDRCDGIICFGDIGFMGYDQNDRPEFSVNFRMILEPVNGTHREAL